MPNARKSAGPRTAAAVTRLGTCRVRRLEVSPTNDMYPRKKHEKHKEHTSSNLDPGHESDALYLRPLRTMLRKHVLPSL